MWCGVWLVICVAVQLFIQPHLHSYSFKPYDYTLSLSFNWCSPHQSSLPFHICTALCSLHEASVIIMVQCVGHWASLRLGCLARVSTKQMFQCLYSNNLLTVKISSDILPSLTILKLLFLFHKWTTTQVTCPAHCSLSDHLCLKYCGAFRDINLNYLTHFI